MSLIPLSIGKPRRDWRHKIETATRILVAGYRQSPRRFRPPEVRQKVIEAAREALGDTPGAGMYRDAPGPAEDVLMSSAGVFRLVLVEEGVAWSEPIVAESVMAVVERTLDKEFARERPGRTSSNNHPTDPQQEAL